MAIDENNKQQKSNGQMDADEPQQSNEQPESQQQLEKPDEELKSHEQQNSGQELDGQQKSGKEIDLHVEKLDSIEQRKPDEQVESPELQEFNEEIELRELQKPCKKGESLEQQEPDEEVEFREPKLDEEEESHGQQKSDEEVESHEQQKSDEEVESREQQQELDEKVESQEQQNPGLEVDLHGQQITDKDLDTIAQQKLVEEVELHDQQKFREVEDSDDQQKPGLEVESHEQQITDGVLDKIEQQKTVEEVELHEQQKSCELEDSDDQQKPSLKVESHGQQIADQVLDTIGQQKLVEEVELHDQQKFREAEDSDEQQKLGLEVESHEKQKFRDVENSDDQQKLGLEVESHGQQITDQDLDTIEQQKLLEEVEFNEQQKPCEIKDSVDQQKTGLEVEFHGQQKFREAEDSDEQQKLGLEVESHEQQKFSEVDDSDEQQKPGLEVESHGQQITDEDLDTIEQQKHVEEVELHEQQKTAGTSAQVHKEPPIARQLAPGPIIIYEDHYKKSLIAGNKKRKLSVEERKDGVTVDDEKDVNNGSNANQNELGAEKQELDSFVGENKNDVDVSDEIQVLICSEKVDVTAQDQKSNVGFTILTVVKQDSSSKESDESEYISDESMEIVLAHESDKENDARGYQNEKSGSDYAILAVRQQDRAGSSRMSEELGVDITRRRVNFDEIQGSIGAYMETVAGQLVDVITENQKFVVDVGVGPSRELHLDVSTQTQQPVALQTGFEEDGDAEKQEFVVVKPVPAIPFVENAESSTASVLKQLVDDLVETGTKSAVSAVMKMLLDSATDANNVQSTIPSVEEFFGNIIVELFEGSELIAELAVEVPNVQNEEHHELGVHVAMEHDQIAEEIVVEAQDEVPHLVPPVQNEEPEQQQVPIVEEGAAGGAEVPINNDQEHVMDIDSDTIPEARSGNENEDPEPIGGIALDLTIQFNYRIISMEEVIQYMQDEIYTVNRVLALQPPTTRMLLQYFRWNHRLLYENYNNNNLGQVFDQLRIGDPFVHLPQHPQSMLCVLCGYVRPNNQNVEGALVVLDCRHYVCSPCLTMNLTAQMAEDYLIQFMKCPTQNCVALIDDEIVISHLNDADKARYMQTISKIFADFHKFLNWCPSGVCGKAVAVETALARPVTCECHHVYCFVCGYPWHAPINCRKFGKWMVKFDSNHYMDTCTRLRQDGERCIRCIQMLNREGESGLLYEHIRCPNYRSDYCWACLQPFQGLFNHFCDIGQLRALVSNERDTTRGLGIKFRQYYNVFAFQFQRIKMESIMYEIVLTKIRNTPNGNVAGRNLNDILVCTQTLFRSRRAILSFTIYCYFNQTPSDSDLLKTLTLLIQYVDWLERYLLGFVYENRHQIQVINMARASEQLVNKLFEIITLGNYKRSSNLMV